QYYAEDFLGSSRVITQNNGAVCYDADFDPYGSEHPYTNNCPSSNAYKFEGKERDSETGNDDFGARYYTSRFGRWLSADWSSVPVPVPYANLTNPQTLNLYAMVSDDPESFADLDGHATQASYGTSPENGSAPTCTAQGAGVNGTTASGCGSNSSDEPTNVIKDLPIVGKALNFLLDGDNVAKASRDLRDAETLQGKIGEGVALGLIVAINVVPGVGETGKAIDKGAELAIDEASRVISKGEKIAQLTAAAKEAYPKLAAKADQLHHIIPKYLGGAADGAKVSLNAAYHQLITNEFRKLAPYGRKFEGAVEELAQKVYSKFPLP
ncbi:MAG: RHS repeat-associated core domain-containing protein, partial [Candidatus Acidiferrum sp.]